MDEQFGISRGDVEAAEAETARKLAADRAVELESPALRTYVSENPNTEGLFIGTASTQLINRSSEDRDRAIGGLSSSPRSHRRFSPQVISCPLTSRTRVGGIGCNAVPFAPVCVAARG